MLPLPTKAENLQYTTHKKSIAKTRYIVYFPLYYIQLIVFPGSSYMEHEIPSKSVSFTGYMWKGTEVCIKALKFA